jgi:hypothetical protein
MGLFFYSKPCFLTERMNAKNCFKIKIKIFILSETDDAMSLQDVEVRAKKLALKYVSRQPSMTINEMSNFDIVSITVPTHITPLMA